MRAMVVTKSIAPPLPELTAAQELALLCRCLFAEGYDDHLAGHITYKHPDGTLLVNPFGLTWDEVTASDINGNNRPSQPYRLRIVVHEDDDGRMTAYDLKYPNGGN